MRCALGVSAVTSITGPWCRRAASPMASPRAPVSREIVRAGREIDREVRLCGDMGSDPTHIPALLAAGMRTLSVAPALVGRAKLAIAETVAGSS